MFERHIECESLTVKSPHDDSKVLISSNPVGIFIRVYNQEGVGVVNIDISRDGGHISTHLANGTDKWSDDDNSTSA
jgi:hypothetical protein